MGKPLKPSPYELAIPVIIVAVAVGTFINSRRTEKNAALVPALFLIGIALLNTGALWRRSKAATRVVSPQPEQIAAGLYPADVSRSLSLVGLLYVCSFAGVFLMILHRVPSPVTLAIGGIVLVLVLLAIGNSAKEMLLEVCGDGLRMRDQWGSYLIQWNNVDAAEVSLMGNSFWLKIRLKDREAFLATVDGPPTNGRDARSVRAATLMFIPEVHFDPRVYGLDTLALLQTVQAHMKTGVAQSG